MRCHCSTVSVSKVEGKGPAMPALLTSPLSLPSRAIRSSMMRFQSSSFAVSCSSKRALPPICCTVSRPPGLLMSVTTSVAPSAASSFAVARPIPDPAPVTSTTLSATRLMRSVPELS